MASKSGRIGRKDPTSKVDSPEANSPSNMAATVTALLEEHRQAIIAEFKASFSALEHKLDQIQATVTEHNHKIVSLESNATLADARLAALETACAKLTDSQAKLQAKVLDLESRSRRNNIRIVGLPESIEGIRPTAFFAEMLAEVFGAEVFPSPPELDRAHRAPIAKPSTGERPRTVIIRLQSFRQKDAIIREARAKRGKLQFRGSPIAVYEDYAPEVVEQRSKYREVLSALYNLGLKPSLQFPARLVITARDGHKMRLSSVAEAKEFIKTFQAEPATE